MAKPRRLSLRHQNRQTESPPLGVIVSLYGLRSWRKTAIAKRGSGTRSVRVSQAAQAAGKKTQRLVILSEAKNLSSI